MSPLPKGPFRYNDFVEKKKKMTIHPSINCYLDSHILQEIQKSAEALFLFKIYIMIQKNKQKIKQNNYRNIA